MNLVALIVEDEPLELEFLTQLAREILSPGDTLVTATSGTQAVRMAKKYKPHLLIMDLILPEMDGMTAIEEIRRFLPEACVIISSASSDFSFAQKAIRLDAFEYLLKPIKPRQFRQVMESAIESIGQGETAHTPAPSPETTDSHCYIEKSVCFIKDNFRDKLTLEMVASHVFMNPQYFSRVFKKEMGMTYTEYVNFLKIDLAKRLLETTDYPAYRISSECGFTDPSYFNRVFLKHEDMTPMEYKKEFFWQAEG